MVLYVLVSARPARHRTRRERPGPVSVQALSLIPNLVVILVVLAISSIK